MFSAIEAALQGNIHKSPTSCRISCNAGVVTTDLVGDLIQCGITRGLPTSCHFVGLGKAVVSNTTTMKLEHASML